MSRRQRSRRGAKRPSSSRGAVLAAVLAVAALWCFVAAGCSRVPPVPVPSPAPGVGTYAAHPDGSVEATGYVGHSDLEGGFWALYDRPAGPSASVRPRILAVLLPGSIEQGGISALEGVFVRVRGHLAQGVSTRNVGPEVLVDAIGVVTSDTPR